MGWSTLGDQCINDGKLLACSYYSNSIGVWVADISVLLSFLVTYSPFFLISLIFSVQLSQFKLYSLWQLIEPYGSTSRPEQNDNTEQKINLNFQGSHSLEKGGTGLRSTSGLRCVSPDYDTKEIKNIYVDCKLLFVFFRNVTL